MDYQAVGGRMPIDSRLVTKISRNPIMVAEQGGSQFMSNYGGSGTYVKLAKMPYTERLVYAAQLEGYSNPDEIAIVTGLNIVEVNKVVSKQTPLEVI